MNEFIYGEQLIRVNCENMQIFQTAQFKVRESEITDGSSRM